LIILFIIGGGLAFLNAYWNDGLMVSCVLVLGLPAGIMWGTYGIFWSGRGELGIALIGVSLAIGASGYAIGRAFRAGHTDEGVDQRDEWMRGLLLGENHALARRWGFISVGLCLASAGLLSVVGPFASLPIDDLSLIDLFFPFFESGLVLVILHLGGIGLAMGPGSQDAGLLTSWGIVFGPVFGAGAVWLPRDPHIAGLVSGIQWAFVGALVSAAVLGTIGYVLGTGLRRAVIPRYPEQSQSGV